MMALPDSHINDPIEKESLFVNPIFSDRQAFGMMQPLMDSIGESSVVFLVRFPFQIFSSFHPADMLADALKEILPEPGDVRIFPMDRRIFAMVLTPKCGIPYDPMQVHALLNLFRQAVQSACVLISDPENNSAPVILPLMHIGSIQDIQGNLSELNELLETIVQRKLRVQFQPIVSMSECRVMGYEALIRVPQTGQMKRAGLFYQAADRARLVSWLDIACQEQCFAEAEKCGVKDHLFINMDAEGLSYLNLSEHSLLEQARERHINPGRVVIEITERQTVEDFPRLMQYIKQLREEGFKIAIDDAGEGYSSLRAISEIRPEFIKIDRSMMRSIDMNGARQALLKTLTGFAHQIGASVIAEGVETRDELSTAMELGVGYVQGYLLGKPNDTFRGVRREMRDYIHQKNLAIEQRKGAASSIALYMRTGLSVDQEIGAEQILNKFTRNPDLESLVVLQNGEVQGLLMRDAVEKERAGGDADAQQLLRRAMNRQPVKVESDASIAEVALLAAKQPLNTTSHSVLVMNKGEYQGIASVRVLLSALAEKISP
jgi:EAL domain-containing protein (putative c-di-GMP-specific phosphodiesterase class I)